MTLGLPPTSAGAIRRLFGLLGLQLDLIGLNLPSNWRSSISGL